ncbi:hypothetical protein [Mangrovibacterium lignilyticum]|uniref:hypothetical protein n=1 Tax=Mangrovibacterium lignilyticum TaxID=2668052 RepID=UPI0013D0C3D6|nr:hypothetical protein [Mangrovibacterium lignilyticum]
MYGYLSKQLIFYIFSLLFLVKVNAQEAPMIPASLQALGGSGVSLGGAEPVVLNPSSASLSGFTGGITYSNRFLLEDLSSVSVVMVIPVAKSRFLASVGQFGNDAFRETQLGIGLAKAFGERFSGGIQFYYFNLKMAESVQNPALVTFNIGLQYRHNSYGFGLSFFNPMGLEMNSTDFNRDYPLVIRFGAHKVFQEDFLVLSQLSYDDEQNVTVHFGLQYYVLRQFCIRAGFQTKSPGWSMGLGYLTRRMQSDIAFSYHEYLGFSPSISLYFKRP